MRLRYYQGRIDVTKHCNLFFAGPPYPIRITERVLFTPDVGVHYCSAQRMTDLEHLDFQAEFEPNVEVPDEIVEAWDAELNSGEADNEAGPVSWHSVVESYEVDGPIVLRGEGSPICEHAYQGEYEETEDDRALDLAREDAQGNHLI